MLSLTSFILQVSIALLLVCAKVCNIYGEHFVIRKSYLDWPLLIALFHIARSTRAWGYYGQQKSDAFYVHHHYTSHSKRGQFRYIICQKCWSFLLCQADFSDNNGDEWNVRPGGKCVCEERPLPFDVSLSACDFRLLACQSTLWGADIAPWHVPFHTTKYLQRLDSST